jgi:hypothetical protein
MEELQPQPQPQPQEQSLVSNVPEIQQTSIFTYFMFTILVVLFLCLVGLNAFVYLAKGATDTSTFIESFLLKLEVEFGSACSYVGKHIANFFVLGYKTKEDSNNQNASTTTLTTTSTATEPSSTTVQANVSKTNLATSEISDESATTTPNQGTSSSAKTQDEQYYVPSESKVSSGWCFIGEDKGYRSCLQVDSDVACSSGQIYDSEEKCKAPNLRF